MQFFKHSKDSKTFLFLQTYYTPLLSHKFLQHTTQAKQYYEQIIALFSDIIDPFITNPQHHINNLPLLTIDDLEPIEANNSQPSNAQNPPAFSTIDLQPPFFCPQQNQTNIQ